MRVFITGASGFVGGTGARSLVNAGNQVFAMSRSEASDAVIRDLGGEPVRCDLENVAAEHVGDAEIVLHSAAFVEDWGPKDAWYRYNVLGTQAMLNAAQVAGVRRFIHIGTEAAICHGQHVRDADETVPLAPDSPYPYCATKAQAEKLVRDANRDGAFETIVLRPRFIWGPGDTTLLPMVEAMAKSGKWMWINDGKAMTSTTHIANLDHAIHLALDKGRPGEAYFILDEGIISLKDMIGSMARARGVTLPDKSIASGLAEFVGLTSEGVWRMFNLNGSPPLTAHAAMVMSRDCTLNGSKAAADLGYQPVLSRAAGWAAL